jgi:hypothetical protein
LTNPALWVSGHIKALADSAFEQLHNSYTHRIRAPSFSRFLRKDSLLKSNPFPTKDEREGSGNIGRKRPIDEEEEQRLHIAEEADVAPASRPAVTRTSPSAFERAPSFSRLLRKGGKAKKPGYIDSGTGLAAKGRNRVDP